MTLKTLTFYPEFEQYELDQFKDEGITTNPSDYYFSLQVRDQGDVEIVITPKKLFDAENRWSDSDYVAPILMESGHLNGYSDLCESIYGSDNALTADEIRTELSSRGFVENPKLHA